METSLVHREIELILHENRPQDALDRANYHLQNQPQDAEILYLKAAAQFALQQWNDSIACLQQAILLAPQNPEFLHQLGKNLRQQNRTQEALDAFQKLVQLTPKQAQAWSSLGSCYAALQMIPAALKAFETALQLDPKHRASWNNLGNLLYSQKHLHEAIGAFIKAQQIDPSFAAAHVSEGVTRLLLGEFDLGWLKFEYRWLLLKTDPQRGFLQPLWRGHENVSGKSILIHAEQGLGDTLQFARYAIPLIQQGATVHLESQPALVSLMRSLPGISSVTPQGDPLPPFDLHCPLMSLPLAFQTLLKELPVTPPPYLTSSPASLARWQALTPSKKPRIGIVWRGNPKHHNDLHRSVPIQTFRSLLSSTICQFVNLQLNPTAEESIALQSAPNCIDLTDQIQHYDDTAALIQSLDLVISVDTSVAHLAGALGKPVWILLPFAPDWRWGLSGTNTRWYPSAKLFRQPRYADWTSVIRNVRLELENRLKARPA